MTKSKAPKTLAFLLQGLPVEPAPAPGMDVGGVSLHSKQVHAGDVFFAYAGGVSHGARFADDAVAAGALAVVVDELADAPSLRARLGVPVYTVPGLKNHLSLVASRFFGDAAQDQSTTRVIGVTGTNGKTSCSHFVGQAYRDAGKSCFVVGTLGNGFYPALSSTQLTTPDAFQLQALLHESRAQHADAFVMEVSSHALDQGRALAVPFDVAVFTNLSRDHLDYHGDMQRYAAAKKRLFEFASVKHAVINCDDVIGKRMAADLPRSVNKVCYSLNAAESADLRATVMQRNAEGLVFRVSGRFGTEEIRSELIGAFNAANLLAVMGVLLSLDWKFSDAVAALHNIKSIAGRLQRFGGNGMPVAVVDYAHTPDALEKVLQTLAEHCARGTRLWCVFGCGGDRDRGKRPLMGQIAERLAQRVVVTDDNPRREDAARIRQEILQGMSHPEKAHVEADRAAAIHYAIHNADTRDIILIAGKGHEDYQIVGDQRLPFSDQVEVQHCLRERAA